MNSQLRWLPLFAAASLALAASADAGDYWVDARNGSNANAGTSPGSAWRTITHALATYTPTAGDTIHVLPGLYDKNLGEVFPLVLQPGLTLSGAGTGEVTIAPGMNKFGIGFGQAGSAAVESLTVKALTTAKGAGGISLYQGNTFAAARLTLRNLVVAHVKKGIYGISTGPFAPIANIVMEDVLVEDCTTGIYLENSFDAFGLDATLLRGTVRDCDVGLHVYGWYGFWMNVDVLRSRFLSNGTAAIDLENVVITDIRLRLVDSLVAGGSGDGVTSFVSKFFVEGSTIAHNQGAGLRQTGSTCCASWAKDSILYGNGDDLDSLVHVPFTNCNVGDGDQQGTDGNLSVDPLFVDPASGDFRLGFASACVDYLPPDGGELDLAGFPRDNDGDLDLLAGRDLGALELRTLVAAPTAPLGQFWTGEMFGPPGESSLLGISLTGLAPAPFTTPYGERWLPAGGLLAVGPTQFLGPGPAPLSLPMPDDPALLGLTLGLQALTRNPAAPAGAAWGEPGVVLVVP